MVSASVRSMGAVRSIVPVFLRTIRLKHYCITVPIFYANAKPHIGHLYSALLGDCAFRWHIMKAGSSAKFDRSIFVAGTDEHGMKIQKAAKASGMDPDQFCDIISNKFKNMFELFKITPTYFVRTTQKNHEHTVASVWSILKSKGLIHKNEYTGWYSITDECFYTQEEVASNSGHMVSVVTGSPVEWVKEENYVFTYEKFIPTIRKWLTESDVIFPNQYLPLVLNSLDTLTTLSISRDRSRLGWGIPVPEDSSQTIYVWVDALCSYLTASGFPSFATGSWPPECQVVGKDILKFHAVYWPAMLLALDLPLPKKLFVHSHWLSNGIKMSKSIGNVVDPTAAAELLSVDGLRYFLLKQGLPQNDADFTTTKAVDVINADLVNTIGNLLSRSTVKKLNSEQSYTTFYPHIFDGEMALLNADFIEKLTTLRDRCAIHYDDLMIYKVLTNILEVAYKANSLFAAYEPWKIKCEKKLSSVLYMTYEAVRICSILLQPVVPDYASKALSRLGIRDNERTLDNAVFIERHDDMYSGRSFGKDGSALLKRIVIENGDKNAPFGNN